MDSLSAGRLAAFARLAEAMAKQAGMTEERSFRTVCPQDDEGEYSPKTVNELLNFYRNDKRGNRNNKK